MPATAVIANLQCTSSACWYLQGTRCDQKRFATRKLQRVALIVVLTKTGPRRGGPPSEGLLLGTELQGVEAIVSWQVPCQVCGNFAAWKPKRPAWACA